MTMSAQCVASSDTAGIIGNGGEMRLKPVIRVKPLLPTSSRIASRIAGSAGGDHRRHAIAFELVYVITKPVFRRDVIGQMEAMSSAHSMYSHLFAMTDHTW